MPIRKRIHQLINSMYIIRNFFKLRKVKRKNICVD